MELKCTNCGDNIDSSWANVKTDLVQCRNCSEIHKLSLLIRNEEQENEKYGGFPDRVYRSNFEDRAARSSLSLREVPEKPAGSKIEVFSTYSTLEVVVPPRKIDVGDIFILGFATFWLSFVAVWTFFAASAFILMAAFSIPFWAVGIFMAGGIIKRLTETQRIEIDENMVTISKRSLFFKQKEEIPFYNINKIGYKAASTRNGFSSMSNTMQSSNSRGSKQIELPTIQAGVEDIIFFENAISAEQEWMIDILNKVVQR